METCITCHAILEEGTKHVDIGTCIQAHTRRLENLEETLTIHTEQHDTDFIKPHANEEKPIPTKLLLHFNEIHDSIEELTRVLKIHMATQHQP